MITQSERECSNSPVPRGPRSGLGGGCTAAETQGDGLRADLNGLAIESHGVVLDLQGVAVADN